MKNLTADQKRNLHVLIVACILNFSFALEKLFIVIGHQLPDAVWLVVYGGFWVYLAWIAIHDYIHDIKEGSGENNNVLI